MLSEHARAKRGDMVLEIDDRLVEAIEKAQRLRTRDEGGRLESNALPSKRDPANGDRDDDTRLTPREIQQRLRAGESITSIARSSGTEEAWIRRFAAPVLAEQARVIERARSLTFTKRGVGPSGASLGPAVAANVIDRGVPLTLPELEAGWGAYQRPQGAWHVTFTFPLRGRRQTAEWELDVTAGELTARNKLAGELGWRESGRKLPQPKPAKAPPAKRTPARKTATAAPEPAAPEPAAPEPVAGAPATEAPAGETAVPAATTGPGAEAGDHTVQSLPLQESAEALPPGEVREVSLRKPRKPPAGKRAAAAADSGTPAQSVVAVPSSQASSSMPPTDLDVVDMVVDLTALDEDTAREPAPIGSPPAPPGGPPAP